MKYCPECGGEFVDQVAACSDCGKALISEADWKRSVAARKAEDRESFVRVATATDQFDADVMREALEVEQIPVLVRNFQETSFNGLFVPQQGWGIICVPEELRSKAAAVIADLRASRSADEGEEPEGDQSQ